MGSLDVEIGHPKFMEMAASGGGGGVDRSFLLSAHSDDREIDRLFRGDAEQFARSIGRAHREIVGAERTGDPLGWQRLEELQADIHTIGEAEGVDEATLQKYETRLHVEIIDRKPTNQMTFMEASELSDTILDIPLNRRDQRQTNRLGEAEVRKHNIQEMMINRGYASQTRAEEKRLTNVINRLGGTSNVSSQDRADLINQIRDYRRNARQEEVAAQRNLRERNRGNARVPELQRNTREAVFHYVMRRAEELEEQVRNLTIEPPKLPEVPSVSFKNIIDRLNNLISSTSLTAADKAEVRLLLLKHNQYMEYARAVGFFSTLDEHIIGHLNASSTSDEGVKRLTNLRTNYYSNEARSRLGSSYSNKLDGLVEHRIVLHKMRLESEILRRTGESRSPRSLTISRLLDSYEPNQPEPQAIADLFKREEDRPSLSPEKQRFNFFKAEQAGREFTPERNFYVGLNEKQMNELEIRLTISNARAKKEIQFKPEDVSGIEISGLLDSDIDEMLALPGVYEAVTSYVAFFTTRDVRRGFGNFSRLASGLDIRRSGKKIEVKNIHSFYSSDELDVFRKGFQGYLRSRISGLTTEQARDAEQIAYNLTFLSDLAEWANSVHSPIGSRDKNSLVQGIGRSVVARPRETALEALLTNKNWGPGVEITLMRNNRDYYLNHPDKIPIPEGWGERFNSFLHATKVRAGGREKTLYEVFKNQGEAFLRGDDIERSDKIKIAGYGNTSSFSNYYIALNKAILMTQVYRDGQPPRDKTLSDVASAMETLGLDEEVRWDLFWILDYTQRDRPIKINPGRRIIGAPNLAPRILPPLSRGDIRHYIRNNYPGWFS